VRVLLAWAFTAFFSRQKMKASHNSPRQAPVKPSSASTPPLSPCQAPVKPSSASTPPLSPHQYLLSLTYSVCLLVH